MNNSRLFKSRRIEEKKKFNGNKETNSMPIFIIYGTANDF
jgi:hypothetical protein